ncbi:MAG TPA: FkbM family methyltransferase [Nitrospiraceae bacterium]|nr:FkbM family methyltransferase [Nitrospiraceae bacterium]
MSASPSLPVDRTALVASTKLLRLGTTYGGWIIPVDAGLTADSICYCAGAGEDISSDCALVERFHCQVRVIDPTPRAIQHFHNLEKAVRSGQRYSVNNSAEDYYRVTAEDLGRLRLVPVGLADRDTELKFYLPKNPAYVSCSTVNLQKTAEYFTAPCVRVSSLMQQLGDTSIDLLKMDIEGAEYAVIRDLVATKLLPRVLLVEFDEAHTPMDGEAGTRIKHHIELLEHAGMRCIAVDGCNASFIRAG